MYRGIVAPALVAVGLGFLTAPALATEEGPGLSLTKTVYPGYDGGAGCGGAANFAEADQDEPVTYCFTVTNTGTTHLGSIVVTDALVPGTPSLLSADSTPLAPGHSARYFLETTPPADEADGAIDETFLNTASASALAVDGAGIPTGAVEPLTATAEAVVYPPEVVPVASLGLVTSVYAGHDGGVGCPAADVTLVAAGDPVTYCLEVTNTGTTHLDGIAFADLGVEGTPTLISGGPLPLAPGASARFHLDGIAPPLDGGSFMATASAQANPVDDTGAVLAGLASAHGSDGALIEALPIPVLPPPVPARPPITVQSPVAAQPQTQTQAQAPAQAPAQLAYTGWETWLLVTAGVGLAATGWLLATSTSGPSAPPRRQASSAGRSWSQASPPRARTPR